LSAEIKGLSLKNAFNNTAAFTLLDARKICAVKRIIRLIFASSAEIMRKPLIAGPAMQLQYQIRVGFVTVG
jgi:hypothetical protein